MTKLKFDTKLEKTKEYIKDIIAAVLLIFGVSIESNALLSMIIVAISIVLIVFVKEVDE